MRIDVAGVEDVCQRICSEWGRGLVAEISHPQPSPQNPAPYTTSANFGSPRGLLSRCKTYSVQIHTSSLFNTFNNLTRLTGTAKYLIVRTRQNLSGCGCGYSSALDFLFCRHRASRVAYKAGSRARGTVNATGADLAC